MLALVGSGEYLPAMEAVDCALISRLQDPPRVVCLPTAAGQEGQERIEYWSQLGIDHFEQLEARVEAIPVVDYDSANDPEYAERIAAANFVYLSGGKPDYLYRVLNGSLAWDAILSVLCEGGLLAGCSAGAMILGEKFFGFPGWKSGFDLVHGAAIIPHFDQIPEGAVRPIRMLTGHDLVILGIEGNTALVQCGDDYEVLGSGGVTVWSRSGKQRYQAGSLPRWSRR